MALISMRRIVMLAVVSLIMALTVALSGTAALAAPGPPPENERALCALAAVAVHFGGGPNPGELFGPGGPCGTE
jgi:hypothetical protein